MMLHPYRSELVNECSECGGDGQCEYEVKEFGGPPGAYSPFREVLMECQACEGTGEVLNDNEAYDDE